ncbi:MAG: hypothetical protein DRN12_02835 [Thermoplasmata archaeon]|nr:MAG: hypothetical protein DRN12_02835 [Thermoplasmata archaeon]
MYKIIGGGILLLLMVTPSVIVGMDDSITIKPSTPNGDNGWYLSDVYVTFHAFDPPEDSSGLAYIYYRIIKVGEEEPPWEKYEIEGFVTRYNFTVHLAEDGRYILEFYAEDHVGNTGHIHSTSEIRIDKNSPNGNIIIPKDGYIYLFGRESFKNPFGYTLMIGSINIGVDAIDEISGIYRVHFEIQDDKGVYSGDDTTSPYNYMFLKHYALPTDCILTVNLRDIAGNSIDIQREFVKWL